MKEFKNALRELVDSAARGGKCTKKELAHRARTTEGTLSKATGDKYSLARWGGLSRSIISTCLENAGRPAHEQEWWKERWIRAHATQGHTPEPVTKNDPQDHTPEPATENDPQDPGTSSVDHLPGLDRDQTRTLLDLDHKAAHAASETQPPEMTGPEKPPVRQPRKRALVAGGAVLALMSGVAGAVIAALLISHPEPPVSVSGPTPPGLDLCDGPDEARICVAKSESGNLEYWAATNTSKNCYITMKLYDDVSIHPGPTFEASEACKPGVQSYRPHPLSNPTEGRRYHAELEVRWKVDGGPDEVDRYESPTLTW